MRYLKRIGQLAVLIFNVFFGPLPVPEALTVWPRIIIALAIVFSLPLLPSMKPASEWRIKLTILAGLFVLLGVAFGVAYWLTLPTHTLELPVRGGLHVCGEPTKETSQALEQLDVDLAPYIDGNPHREVESFFDPASVLANKLCLALLYIPFIWLVTLGIMILLEWIPSNNSPPSCGVPPQDQTGPSRPS